MIGDFLRWWGQQLLSLLPASGARPGDAVIAVLRAPGLVELIVRRRGKEGALGRFALDPAGIAALRAARGSRRAPVLLRLPAGMLLAQPVVLPLAAERDPERVLRYEMDRLTPFAADELFWTASVVRRDRARAQLHLRLALVPRAQLAPVLEGLAQAGLHPGALEGPAGERIELAGRHGGRWRQRAASGLAAACVLLAVAAAAVPFALQSRESRRIERRIATLRPAVEQAEALRRGIATTAAGIDVLASQRARVGNPLAVLAALTDILPDDTVLTDLGMRQRVITLSGQAASAARLIPALAADPAFRDPAFAAPVTRNETTRGEGFSIRAEAAP